MTTLTRRQAISGILAAPLLARARGASAAGLPAPTGEVILTLSGAVSATNAGGAVDFDLPMLDALPQRSTVTATPWHEGRPTFSGPLLSAVLDAAGAEGGTLRLVALNDYAAEMPRSDALDIPVILATRIDGQEISVRDKGPIFVIYPFDEQPELFNEIYFNRSVWQVATIEVSP